jgi:hypothetical protein
MSSHALHLGLQLVSSNGPLPVIVHRLRVAQIIFHFLFQLRLRHNRFQRWLATTALVWPGAMTPVNVFDRCLICNAFCEAQALVPVCIRAEGGVTLQRKNLGTLLRQMNRRAEGDNDAGKKQCARAAAKNVSAKFVVRFHSYTSVLRREPASRLTLREEGQVELLGETPNEFDSG